MSKHHHDFFRCMPDFDSLEERNLLSHTPGWSSLDLPSLGPPPPVAREVASPGLGAFDSQHAHPPFDGHTDAWSSHRPYDQTEWSSGNGNGIPLASRSTSTFTDSFFAQINVGSGQPVLIVPIRHSNGSIAILVGFFAGDRDVPFTVAPTSPGSEARATDRTPAGSNPISFLDEIALVVATNGSPTAMTPNVSGPVEPQANRPSPSEVAGSPRPVNYAPDPRPFVVSPGLSQVAPAEPIRSIPGNGPPIVVSLGHTGAQSLGRSQPPSPLPPPRGADLITDVVPFDGKPLDASLNWLLDRFGGFGDPLQEKVHHWPSLFPIVFGMVAFEAVRRWRRRRTSSRRRPAQSSPQLRAEKPSLNASIESPGHADE